MYAIKYFIFQCILILNIAYIQDYVNTYVNIPETESLVNDQMAAYEERELNVNQLFLLYQLQFINISTFFFFLLLLYPLTFPHIILEIETVGSKTWSHR